jgi:uncharacterized membrane protein
VRTAEMMTDEHARGSAENRGLDRIISLSDGIFAFAITLLVLSLVVPATIPATNSVGLLVSLSSEYQAYFGYGVSFTVISIWWIAHHRIFRYINKFDTRLMWMNLGFLLFITINPFLTQILSKYGNLEAGVIIYDSAQILGGLAFTGVWRYASKMHFIEASLTTKQIKAITTRGLVTPLVFLAAIGVSFLLGYINSNLISFSNFTLFAIFPISRKLSLRRSKTIPE